MADGFEIPSVTMTSIEGVEDPPVATLPMLLGADELEYDPETRRVRVPPELTDGGEPVRVVPDELAAQLGHDG